MEEIDQIRALKRALETPGEEFDLDIDLKVPCTNRGNKLVQGARFVSARSIAVPQDQLGVSIVEFNGHKRAVLVRHGDSIQDSDEMLDNRSDILEDVNLDAILKPVADPADIPTHPAISRTFNSTYLANMAQETLDIIVQEKAHAAKISNLLSAFLGDDPKALALDKLGVKEYSGNAEQDMETFFAPPQTCVDKNYGVSEETAEEARQLLQIAHQRLEEFVQCMTTIRMGFTHANRKRRKVLNWCKELNHQDYIEEEIGPEEDSQSWGPLTDYKNQPSGMSGTERSE